MIWLCGDPGSTHDGSLEKARELVKIGAGCGLNAIKFQLLSENETKAGNILLPWSWLPELIDLGKSLGVKVFASVFNREGAEWLRKCDCKSFKFSYSQRKNLHWLGKRMSDETIYVSCDVMNMPEWGSMGLNGPFDSDKGWKRLFCLPAYPVPYIVDFEGLFPRFEGFSSHCLGIKQEIAAVQAGAKYLEFHYQGNWYSPCPDARFAKSPKLTEELVKNIRWTTPDPKPYIEELKTATDLLKRFQVAFEKVPNEIFKDIPFKSAPAVPGVGDGWQDGFGNTRILDHE